MKRKNNKYANYCSCQRGFSLLELAVVLGMVSILVTSAVPLFTDTIVRSKLESYIQSLATGINIARSEAMRSGQRAVVVTLRAGQGPMDYDFVNDGNIEHFFILLDDGINNGS